MKYRQNRSTTRFGTQLKINFNCRVRAENLVQQKMCISHETVNLPVAAVPRIGREPEYRVLGN